EGTVGHVAPYLVAGVDIAPFLQVEVSGDGLDVGDRCHGLSGVVQDDEGPAGSSVNAVGEGKNPERHVALFCTGERVRELVTHDSEVPHDTTQHGLVED